MLLPEEENWWVEYNHIAGDYAMAYILVIFLLYILVLSYILVIVDS